MEQFEIFERQITRPTYLARFFFPNKQKIPQIMKRANPFCHYSAVKRRALNETESPIQDLNPDLWVIIAQSLSFQDLIILSSITKFFNELTWNQLVTEIIAQEAT